MAKGSPLAAFVEVKISATIKLGDFVEISGSISFGGSTVVVTGVTIFLGEGPGFLPDGTSRNPLARGVFITDVNGFAQGAAGARALAVSGTVELVGFSGVTLAGSVQVLYNETATPVTFGAGTVNAVTVGAGAAGSPYAKVVGDLNLGIAGQSLTGTIGLEKKPTGLRVTFGTSAKTGGSPLTLKLGGDLVTVSVDSGEILLAPAGTALVLQGSIAFKAGISIDLTGAVGLQLNTGTASTVVDGLTLAPQSLRVQIGTLSARANLTVAGQSVSGVFVFSQVTGATSPSAPAGTTGAVTVQIVATAVSVSLGTATAGLRLSDGEAFFALTGAGVAGRVSGTVQLIVPGDAVGFSGTLAVAINTTGARITQDVAVDGVAVTLDLPAGPYLRVEGTAIQLQVAGQRISGNLVFTQSGTAPNTTVTLAVTNLQAGFGNGTTDVATLTNGSGTLTLAPSGMSGSIAGTVSVSVPGVSLSGSIALQLTTTATTADLSLTGNAITLSVGGFALVGSLTLRQQTVAGGAKLTNLTLAVSADFGAPIGSLNLTGALALSPAGMVGHLALTGTSISIGDVTLSADSLRFDVDTIAGTVGLAGVNMKLNLGGPELSGSFSVVRRTTAGGTRTVIAVAGAQFRLSSTDAPILTGIGGIFVVAPTGIAGSLSGTVDLSSVLPADVVVSGSFALLVNRTTSRVTESVTLGGSTISIDIAANLLRVAGNNVTLSMLGQSLQGSVAFQRSWRRGHRRHHRRVVRRRTAARRRHHRPGRAEPEHRLLHPRRHRHHEAPGRPAERHGRPDHPRREPRRRPAVASRSTPAPAASGSAGPGVSLDDRRPALWSATSGSASPARPPHRVTTISASSVSLFVGDPGGTPARPTTVACSLTDGRGSLLLTRAGLAAQRELGHRRPGRDGRPAADDRAAPGQPRTEHHADRGQGRRAGPRPAGRQLPAAATRHHRPAGEHQHRRAVAERRLLLREGHHRRHRQAPGHHRRRHQPEDRRHRGQPVPGG